MGRVKKSTRKFEQNHLKRVLDDRKGKAKLKQQFLQREKKKRATKDDGSDDSGSDGEDAKTLTKKDDGPKIFENMSVEQFFEGGFEVPETSSAGKKKKSAPKSKPEPEPEATDDASGAEEDEDEFEKHKEQLAALAEQDPEFFEYMKKNDPELLDFTMAERDTLSDVDDLSESEEAQADKKKKKGKKGEEKQESTELTMAEVKKWKKAMIEETSLRALRQVVLAFRSAAHANDVEEDKSIGGFKFSITNPNVYHELVLLALEHVPTVLNAHLPVKESASGKIRVATETKKFRTLTPLLKSHSSSLLHLLPLLTDAATQKLLLNSSLELIPYFLSFRKFLKAFLKAVVEIWSSNSTDEATRITAFLVIRRAAVIGDEGMKETCLKALYAGLIKACRQTTAHTIQGINLMKNSAAEIAGLPGMEKVGYQAGFSFIRQLAVHLRNSITNNSKESYKTVYNWQYVHSLDFWSRVLAMHCDGLKEAQAGKESTLRPLIYPLVQVTLGAARLIPTPAYFPLRFYLVRSLLRISQATGVYIPLASLIFEVLSSNEIKSRAKPSTLKPLDFATNIRAPKSYLKTRTYQDGIGEQVVELFSEFYVLYSKSVAFPELAIPTIVQLKRFMKKSQNGKLNGTLQLLVNKLEHNSKWIEEKRSGVEFAPNKREQVDAFLKDVDWETTPLGQYVVSQRKVREEKRRLLEESLREEKEREKRDREAEEEEMEVDSGSEGEGTSEEGDDDVEMSD
ncbi:Noc2-domain-containing protein [Ascodesmis nigricans]|uniref:Noc2-domain-containing protein n=1 Tax=Ascodesmis nigricans TaxID=341454 RepID=A0A4S2MYK1_9PEZI|nr:Noc2-domain-containing protein [Ascodesmis nigricans]